MHVAGRVGFDQEEKCGSGAAHTKRKRISYVGR